MSNSLSRESVLRRSLSRESVLSQLSDSRQRRKRIMDHALTNSLQGKDVDLDMEDKSTTTMISEITDIAYVRSEHARVSVELQLAPKFSPEWLRLKEELVLLSIEALNCDDESKSGSGASFHAPGAVPTVSSGEDDATSDDGSRHVANKPNGNQQLQSMVAQKARKHQRKTGSPSSGSSIQEQLTSYVIEDQPIACSQPNRKQLTSYVIEDQPSACSQPNRMLKHSNPQALEAARKRFAAAKVALELASETAVTANQALKASQSAADLASETAQKANQALGASQRAANEAQKNRDTAQKEFEEAKAYFGHLGSRN